MIRLSTLFWLIVASTAGFAMFAVKYQVQALSDQLVRSAKAADDVERDIRVLDAEWAYLNRPDALAQMNQRFLSLVPIATKQLRSDVSDIPMQPPPPAPIETAAVNAPLTTAIAMPAQDGPLRTDPQTDAPAQPMPEEPRVMPAASLDQEHLSRITKPVATIKASFRSAPLRHAASLDELIAQITETR